MKKINLILAALLLTIDLAYSQSITQNVRGKIIDAVTQKPLMGASVMVLKTNPLIGTACDIQGNFELKNIPIGRQSIQVSMIGYDTYLATELLLTTGKELVLNIGLHTNSTNLNEVVIRVSKDIPLNSMSTLSAKQFTVEETQRYAGGMNDPARLASSFAGVATPSVSSNGISVRGNNPEGLLWRIEGVEVPNPNHFADITVVGGGLFTVISSQMMGNSDFFTGAFPAEYGNATSGVFDIKLKNGNTSKREYTIQAGLIGIDFATEGPFQKGENSSYNVNYRYSTLGLIEDILPEDAGLPKYQDLSFKANFPTKKAGTISLWGIGSLDGLKMEPMDSTLWKADFDRDDADDKLYMFATGLSHKIQLAEKTFINSTFSVSGSGFSHKEQRLDYNLQLHPQSNIQNNTYSYTLQSSVNHRFSNKHTNRTGFYYTKLGYDINIEQALSDGTPLVTLANAVGQSDLLQLYTQSKVMLIPNLILNLGVHYQQFMLNNNHSLEPRVGISYDINQKHNIAFAYGLHSKLERLSVYFVNNNGNYPNKELDLMHSAHYVLAYNTKISKYMRFSIEPYYQYLTNVPVSPTNYISTLNIEGNVFFDDVLVSKGTGRNVGIDFTLEHFLKNGFYFLTTTSLFDSKYTAADGIERNTRFNKNFVFNGLLGKEWSVGKQKNNILGANFRFNYMGGNRIEPINEAASLAAKDSKYGETNNNIAFEKQFDNMPIVSFTVSYRKNKPTYSSVWSIQIINATSTKEFVDDFYNIKTKTIDQKFDGIKVPNISYKIEF